MLSRSGSILRRMRFRCTGPTARAGRFCARMCGGRRCWSSSVRCGPGVVATQARGGAHVGGREIDRPGHDVRLIPPAHVQPFVRRRKNDAAEAICEAALRPAMRLGPVKVEETRGAAMVFRVRELLIRQRTPAINASC